MCPDAPNVDVNGNNGDYRFYCIVKDEKSA